MYRLLAEQGDRLFPDDYFADLYKDSRRGRPTVPARVLATVMVLQAHEGLSDQEAVRSVWSAICAGRPRRGCDAGYEAFHPTVLVGQRNRLRASERPKRFLEDTKVVAREAGVLRDRVRVLDSTPIYDAVSTQDTVTQLRSAIRKLLRGRWRAARWRGGCGRRCRATTTTPRRASRRVTGTTRRPGRRWSTRWCATRWRCSTCSTARAGRCGAGGGRVVGAGRRPGRRAG